jgi:signal transduction histidine kinase
MSTSAFDDPSDQEYLSKETVHHLRNLLLPITGHASLLLDDASLPESAKNGLRDMSEAADQILKVINGIDQESRG